MGCVKAGAESVRAYVTAPLRLMWRLIRSVAPLAPDEALHRMVWAFLGLTVTAGLGVVGYVVIDDFSPFDALYQTLLTLTTVGFQEVYPLSREARIFTVFLMVFGVGIALYLLTSIATLLLEGDLYRDVFARRQRRMIEQMSGHTIFIGAGLMGMMVIEVATTDGSPFVVIEVDGRAAEQARERDWLVMEANALEVDVLRAAGAERANEMYVLTGDDGANLIITLRAMEMADDLRVVARVNRPGNEDLMQNAGASEVLSPYRFAAEQVAASLASRR